MRSTETFNCEPILGFVQKYLMKSSCSVDPFARNSNLCDYTNDLNSSTSADFHLEADVFVGRMIDLGIRADLAIFDPPYSLTQVSKSYNDIGLKFRGAENPTGGFPRVRRLLGDLLLDGGICLSFGWNSCGLGKKLGFEPIEILLVCHGGNANDTICLAEKKITDPQYELIG